MKLHSVLFTAAAILTVATSALAQSGPASTGAIAVPANRIVGLWEAAGTVRPCNDPSAAPRHIRTNLLFQAGGTITENPGGLPNVTGPSRSFGLGTWSYDPDSNHYTLMLRFDTYLNGVYTGYQTVDRDIVLDGTGASTVGPVVSTGYDTNGNQILQLCGTAIQQRL
jgi:hypothetical protein